MTDELKKRLNALRGIAPRLNAVTDEATAIIKAVEKILAEELKLGVSGMSSEFDEERGDQNEDGTKTWLKRHLAFSRAFGSYQIHVLERTWSLDSDDDLFEVIGETPYVWSSCSREQKLKAFTRLPQLLDIITMNSEQLLGEADKASAMIREMMS